MTEIGEGLREADSTHLMSGHGAQEQSAVKAFRRTSLAHRQFRLQPRQGAGPFLSGRVCRPAPTCPFVLIESTYEGEHDSVPEQIRQQAYGAMLSGACGQFIGNNPHLALRRAWAFSFQDLLAGSSWKHGIPGHGPTTQLLTGLAWHRLKPEQGHTIVTEGFGQDLATAMTSHTPDRTLSLTYIPSTGTQSRTLTVDLSRFSGPVTARWYNPTNGH